MSIDQLIVLALLGLPLIGAVIVWCLGPKQGPTIRAVSVAASIGMLFLSLILLVQYTGLTRQTPDEVATFIPEFVPGSTADKPHQTTWNILPVGKGNIQFFVGVDGLNVWLIFLTGVLMLPCVLISFKHITERTNEFYAWLLALQTAMIGVFLSFDIVLFYVFFELTLVPLFFLIGIWGGAQRQYAAKKFVIYTLAGSLITLLGVLAVVIIVYSKTGTLTFALPDLVTLTSQQLAKGDIDTVNYWRTAQVWIFLSMSLGFAIKVPLMPFHTWLPLAHTEAPTAGSVVLAGVLLKVGCYAFLRLCIPLAPDASLSVGLPLITWVSAIGIVYGSLCAFAQEDIKKLIAYSSVSHLGLVMLGMFSLTATGLQGSLIQMINHGLSTPLLFLLVGMIYERYHTRMIKDYGGMAAKLPYIALFLVFSSLSSVGLPGLNGFIGEFLCLAGIYEYEGTATTAWRILPLTFLGASGMVLGAWYLFTMLMKVLFGSLKEPHHEGHHIEDLDRREWGLLLPLVALCFLIGLYPKVVLQPSEADVARIVRLTDDAKVRAEQAKKPTAVAEANRP